MPLTVVFALAAGTYAMRLAGPLLRDRISFSPQWERMMSIAAITLLGAFVGISTVVESGGFAGPARLAGVAIGGALAWFRAPFPVVVVAAALCTAALRLLGVG